MEFKYVDGGVCAANGFLASGIHCGIRKNKDKLDLALIYSDEMCVSVACYTQNKVKGSPIIITQKHLANSKAKAVIVNSGNANTCNLDGEEKAILMCVAVADKLNLNVQDVIVASTGVIGQVLPIEPIQENMGHLVAGLSTLGNVNASSAILTTDTYKKEVAIEFMLGDKVCHIGGMAKGSGMIHPNMATMLCFLTSDVDISEELLKESLISVVTETFNQVSVDGDTSTNDMVSLMCNKTSKNDTINSKNHKDYDTFYQALFTVMKDLSKEIARDGEGATKLLTCNVTNAKTKETAAIVSKSVITSNLFKCAMFGKDANWGRILCAIGYSGGDFNVDKISVVLASCAGEISVCKDGRGLNFTEENAAKILEENEIFINVDLGEKSGISATAWGCDLSYDYVKINGDYRS